MNLTKFNGSRTILNKGESAAPAAPAGRGARCRPERRDAVAETGNVSEREHRERERKSDEANTRRIREEHDAAIAPSGGQPRE